MHPPKDRVFDGRSYSTPLRYSKGQRIVSLIADRLMPIAAVLLPSNRLYTFLWRCLGVQVGKGSVIRLGTRINTPFKVKIGADSAIHGQLKARGGVEIGNGVEFVEEVLVSTQSHNMDSADFESVYAPVKILDHAWIGPRAVVLSGITIGEGCAVGAGSVVTKDCPAWSVVAGVPARTLKPRTPLRRPS
jgi:acetyltransferase-like isoleucine patch superfamily enzyme